MKRVSENLYRTEGLLCKPRPQFLQHSLLENDATADRMADEFREYYANEREHIVKEIYHACLGNVVFLAALLRQCPSEEMRTTLHHVWHRVVVDAATVTEAHLSTDEIVDALHALGDSLFGLAIVEGGGDDGAGIGLVERLSTSTMGSRSLWAVRKLVLHVVQTKHWPSVGICGPGLRSLTLSGEGLPEMLLRQQTGTSLSNMYPNLQTFVMEVATPSVAQQLPWAALGLEQFTNLQELTLHGPTTAGGSTSPYLMELFGHLPRTHTLQTLSVDGLSCKIPSGGSGDGEEGRLRAAQTRMWDYFHTMATLGVGFRRLHLGGTQYTEDTARAILGNSIATLQHVTFDRVDSVLSQSVHACCQQVGRGPPRFSCVKSICLIHGCDSNCFGKFMPAFPWVHELTLGQYHDSAHCGVDLGVLEDVLHHITKTQSSRSIPLTHFSVALGSHVHLASVRGILSQLLLALRPTLVSLSVDLSQCTLLHGQLPPYLCHLDMPRLQKLHLSLPSLYIPVDMRRPFLFIPPTCTEVEVECADTSTSEHILRFLTFEHSPACCGVRSSILAAAVTTPTPSPLKLTAITRTAPLTESDVKKANLKRLFATNRSRGGMYPPCICAQMTEPKAREYLRKTWHNWEPCCCATKA